MGWSSTAAILICSSMERLFLGNGETGRQTGPAAGALADGEIAPQGLDAVAQTHESLTARSAERAGPGHAGPGVEHANLDRLPVEGRGDGLPSPLAWRKALFRPSCAKR